MAQQSCVNASISAHGSIARNQHKLHPVWMIRTLPFSSTILLLALSSCNSRDAATNKVQKSPSTIEALQVLSGRICQCKLAGRNADILEREFSRLTAPLATDGTETTASVPLRHSSTCYPELGVDACVGGPATADDGKFVCGAEQVAKAEAAFDEAIRKGNGDPYSALAEAIDNIKKNAATTTSQADCDQL